MRGRKKILRMEEAGYKKKAAVIQNPENSN
jgi:hypothetical protein